MEKEIKEFLEKHFNHTVDNYEFDQEDMDKLIAMFKGGNGSKTFTENGLKIFKCMRENEQKYINVFKAKEIVMENVNKDYKYDIVTEKGTPCINGLSRNGIITTDKIYYKDTRDSLLFAIDQENSNKLLIFPSKAIIGSTVFPREAIYTSNILIDRLYSVIYQQQRIIDKLILNIADLEDRESSVHKLEINLLQPASDNQSLWEKVDNQSYYRYTVNLATNYYNGNTVTIIGYNVNDGEAIDKLALSKIVVGNNGIIADDNSFTLLSYGSLPLQSLNVTFIFMITPYCTTLEVK